MQMLTVLIKPSSSMCNMQCKYCFYKDETKFRETASYGMMTDETAKILVKKAFEAAQKAVSFMFQGGEPTLAGLPFYAKFVEWVKKYNTKQIDVYLSIQTNGYVIDEAWAQFLHDHHFLVGLSMDGPSDIHDFMRIDNAGQPTHERVMRAAGLFDRYQVEYNVLCVVNNFVAKHADRVYRWFRDHNFRYLQFIPCLDGFDGSKENFSLDIKNFEQFLKVTFRNYFEDYRNGNYVSIRTFDNYIAMLMGRPPESCGMSGFCTCYFVVEADGSVFPCDFYVLDQWKMGNIRTDSFEEMFKSDVVRSFVESSRYIDEHCRKCKWYGLCRGGCRRNREPFVEGRPSLNVFCAAYRGFFKECYSRMKQMAWELSGRRQ